MMARYATVLLALLFCGLFIGLAESNETVNLSQSNSTDSSGSSEEEVSSLRVYFEERRNLRFANIIFSKIVNAKQMLKLFGSPQIRLLYCNKHASNRCLLYCNQYASR